MLEERIWELVCIIKRIKISLGRFSYQLIVLQLDLRDYIWIVFGICTIISTNINDEAINFYFSGSRVVLEEKNTLFLVLMIFQAD